MAITMTELIQKLSADQPDLAQLAKLGSEAVPLLAQLAGSPDPNLAAKATQLAATIPNLDTKSVLLAAAHSPYAMVRTAAAVASHNFPTADVADIVHHLLGDHNPDVLKSAIKAVGVHNTPELQAKLATLDTGSLSKEFGTLIASVLRPAGGK